MDLTVSPGGWYPAALGSLARFLYSCQSLWFQLTLWFLAQPKPRGLEWGEVGRAERPVEGRGQVSHRAQGDPNTPCLLLVFRNKYIQGRACRPSHIPCI